MAITRSQQARQMLKKAGFVVQDGFKNYIKDSESVTVPKEFKSRDNATPTKLAYITKDEAKMLKKMKKGTPHKGPKGIPSYDDFDAATGSFRSGAAMSAAESGKNTSDTLAAGMSAKEVDDIRSSVIAAGAGQRVNPGFFDSRDTVSREELRRAKQFAPKAFARNRRGGILGFLTSGGILGNLLRNIGQKFGLGKTYDEPTYDMSEFNKLGLGGVDPTVNPTFQDDLGNPFLEQLAKDDTNIIIPRKKPEIDLSRRLNDPLTLLPQITPFQKDVIEDTEDQADDPFLQDAMAFKPGSEKDKRLKSLFKQKGLAEDIDAPFPKKLNEELERLLKEDEEQTEFPKTELIRAADGGMIGGGIMDVAGRQQYFLGKLVKKATRAVKKIVKSPIGKAALFATPFLMNSAARTGIAKFLFKKGGQNLGLLEMLKGGLTGGGQFALGAGISALPLLFGQQEEEEPTGFTGSVGGQIDPRAYTDPQSVLFRAFRAEGGSMKEPVAKRTMPLLDMGGQEMDLRAEGGFVPIGRMEKADDVPARLSKNEFVFTADAVRNAGDGDVDKGAEVMYNMMKNLEAGGEVSKESQGLEGARNMFQTSKRLEEVL